MIFTIWLFNIAMENPFWMEVLMGNSSVNGPCSIAKLNNQMVNTSVWPIVTTLNHAIHGRQATAASSRGSTATALQCGRWDGGGTWSRVAWGSKWGALYLQWLVWTCDIFIHIYTIVYTFILVLYYSIIAGKAIDHIPPGWTSKYTHWHGRSRHHSWV